MKALRVILAAGALTAIAGSALAADEQVVKESGSTFSSYLDPVSVRAEVGTTGYGGAISYRVKSICRFKPWLQWWRYFMV